jgi:hypothetical protein
MEQSSSSVCLRLCRPSMKGGASACIAYTCFSLDILKDVVFCHGEQSVHGMDAVLRGENIPAKEAGGISWEQRTRESGKFAEPGISPLTPGDAALPTTAAEDVVMRQFIGIKLTVENLINQADLIDTGERGERCPNVVVHFNLKIWSYTEEWFIRDVKVAPQLSRWLLSGMERLSEDMEAQIQTLSTVGWERELDEKFQDAFYFLEDLLDQQDEVLERNDLWEIRDLFVEIREAQKRYESLKKASEEAAPVVKITRNYKKWLNKEKIKEKVIDKKEDYRRGVVGLDFGLAPPPVLLRQLEEKPAMMAAQASTVARPVQPDPVDVRQAAKSLEDYEDYSRGAAGPELEPEPPPQLLRQLHIKPVILAAPATPVARPVQPDPVDVRQVAKSLDEEEYSRGAAGPETGPEPPPELQKQLEVRQP